MIGMVRHGPCQSDRVRFATRVFGNSDEGLQHGVYQERVFGGRLAARPGVRDSFYGSLKRGQVELDKLPAEGPWAGTHIIHTGQDAVLEFLSN